MSIDRVAVVGAGRVGLTLARALVRSGCQVTVLGRQERRLPPPLEPISVNWAPALASADLVLVAVPDDAIADTAIQLSQTEAIHAGQAVLHTSGLHDRSALSALEPSGAALGSWHPLQTFADREGDPDALTGVPAIVEGDAPAVAAGCRLAALLGLAPVIELAADRKAEYHAAAVFASNYVVVLAEIAGRLARDAGVGDAADSLFLPLLRRTLVNLEGGPVAALTGPVRRGDAATVVRHLEALHGAERALYVMLAQEALQLARRGGLGEGGGMAIEAALRIPY